MSTCQKTRVGLVLLSSLLAASAAAAYEGFGKVTQGASSCPTTPATYHVTSLADSGAGTFRDAVSLGCRRIIFDVGGTITITSDINIRSSYLTIDGATAPAPGITIRHSTINEGVIILPTAASGPVHDIIVRHLRHTAPGGHDDTSSDIWGMDGEGNPVYNIVLDHITVSGSNDGIFDIWGAVTDVTVSWNLMINTVTAMHMASGNNAAQRRISVHHNVFARNNERQMKTRYNAQADFVNNVIYGWGWFGCAGRGLQIDSNGAMDPYMNVENNYFHNVATTACPGDQGALEYQNGVGASMLYLAGNIVPAGETDSGNAPRLFIDAYAEVTKYPAATLGTNVVPNVGTAYRTAAEQTLLNQIAAAIGGAAVPLSPPTGLLLQ